MLRPFLMEPDEFATTLASAKTGNPDALELIFKCYYHRVEEMVHVGLQRDFRINRGWLQSRFSTGDVVQEVFRGLLKDLSTFQGNTEGALLGYLTMVVRNRLMDTVRFHQAAQRDGRQTKPESEQLDLPKTQDGPGTMVAHAEELQIFHEVLESFPERDRLLVRARMEQEATFQDLAEQLGYSSKYAARRAFYAAQAQLAIRLGSKADEPSDEEQGSSPERP